MTFKSERKPPSLVKALLAVLCLCTAASLCGCLETDVLVNHVLDTQSENIDYSNPNKLYEPDPDAEQSSKEVAATTNVPVEEIEKVLKDKAVYNTKNTNSEDAAESGEYSDTTDSATTAAKNTESKNGRKKESSKNNSANKGTGGSSKGEKGTDQNSDPEGNDSKATKSGSVYNANGKIESLPTDIKGVCAVGEAAKIVLSIAGPDYLLGSSQAVISSDVLQKVYGANAISSIAKCWKGDGSDSDDINLDAIIKLKPDAVLTLSGSKTLSAGNQKKLREAGISIVPLPQMISNSYIKKAVKAVGHLFSDATDSASSDKASDYVSTVEKALKSAKDSHGGAVCSYNSVDYDNVTDANPVDSSTAAATQWTVLITGWDADATATASFNGSTIFKSAGVATAKIGWKWSPVSYYLGCGGAVNNAAAYGSYATSSTRMFLTFNENQISYSWSNLDSDISVGHNGGSFSQGGAFLLANACDARSNDSEHHLGSKDFNKVIVTSKSIKKKLQAAQGSNLGLYTPGGYETTASTSGYGIVIGSKLLRCYSAKTDSSRDDTLYDILVNPCGLVSSWTEGSMESFLEAVWAAQEFNGLSASDVRADISNFYKEFYNGYELSSDELDSILDGSYAQDK